MKKEKITIKAPRPGRGLPGQHHLNNKNFQHDLFTIVQKGFADFEKLVPAISEQIKKGKAFCLRLDVEQSDLVFEVTAFSKPVSKTERRGPK